MGKEANFEKTTELWIKASYFRINPSQINNISSS